MFDLRLVLLVGLLAITVAFLARRRTARRRRNQQRQAAPQRGSPPSPARSTGIAVGTGREPPAGGLGRGSPTSSAPLPDPDPTELVASVVSPSSASCAPPTERLASRGPALSDEDTRLRTAVDGLRLRDPGLSAFKTTSRNQRRGVVGLAAAGAVVLVVAPKQAVIGFVAVTSVVYLASLAFRLRLLHMSLGRAHVIEVSDEDARSYPTDDLPSYTIMVPARHEPQVIERLLRSLASMDYPRHKLQVLLLLEADDAATIQAARSLGDAHLAEIVLVPPAEPRTKPKALNYGLQLATGELVTVYDAEDRPDVLQLRKAAIGLRRAPESTACLQAELRYFNPSQNLITRWFSVEYLMWFNQLLPGLSQLGAPVPLGGTSNHFRRAVLEEVGAWDPYNVTEDADLGVRLHRQGYRTGVLSSVTFEEANSDFVNWVRQRSRWYKGYLQTLLVHLRKPRRLWRDLGPGGVAQFNLLVGGTPLIALLNPVFWLLTLAWFIGHPTGIERVFPAPIYYVGLLSWVGGNFTFLYAAVLVALDADRLDLFVASLLTPLYWVMMSVAALKAGYQLVFQPSYWEKTVHGLDRPADQPSPAAPPPATEAQPAA